jgi:heterodisulfide reductase subunit D
MGMADRYNAEKKRYLQHCTRCGRCAKGCPILPHTDLADVQPAEIQKRVFAFVERGTEDAVVSTRALACMECFKCTRGMCPEDLNPMMILEWIKGELIRRDRAVNPISDAADPDSDHRVLASIQTTPEEYARITAGTRRKRACKVFFPGCNVYLQPEKLLNAMDILDALGDDWVLLPGLDYCCGDSGLYVGDIADGNQKMNLLVEALAGYDPEEVLLWCPTCHCRFDMCWSMGGGLPFSVRSFPQYLAANLGKLNLVAPGANLTVTLHEACKSAYTGVDRDGPRRVLEQLPGVNLREMDSCGRKAACCGSGAITWFADSSAVMREARLREAEQTGASKLVTVCHYCNGVFAREMDRFSFGVTSYVSLVAEAMGIERPDRYAAYVRWRNAERILEDAKDRIAGSPFSANRIAAAVDRHFGS